MSYDKLLKLTPETKSVTYVEQTMRCFGAPSKLLCIKDSYEHLPKS